MLIQETQTSRLSEVKAAGAAAAAQENQLEAWSSAAQGWKAVEENWEK